MQAQVLLVAYHKPEQIRRVLGELDATSGVDFRYVIVNNSPDSAVDRVLDEFRGRTSREVVLTRSKHNWFTPAFNEGLAPVLHDVPFTFYVCSVHAAVHHPRWMLRCMRWMREHPKAGIGGSVIRAAGYGNRFDRCNLGFYKRQGLKFDYTARINKRWWSSLTDRQKYNLSHVQGGIWVLRRSMVKRIGLLSPDFFFSFVDVEYSFRAMSYGWQLGRIPGIWADEQRFDAPTPLGTLVSHARRNAE